MTTAAVAGFVIGLAFLVYGAYAAILLHWFFNYYLQITVIGTTLAQGSGQLFSFLRNLNIITITWTIMLGAFGPILAILLLGKRQTGLDSSL